MTTPSTSPPPSQSGSPQPGPSGSGAASVSPERWAAILADLERRGAPTGDVTVVSARQVTWNNGALGCPKPGQSYIQSLVRGMQVIVSAGGRQYDYRFGTTDRPKLCQGSK